MHHLQRHGRSWPLVAHSGKSIVMCTSLCCGFYYCLVAIMILSTPYANCDKLNATSALALQVRVEQAQGDYSYALHSLPNGIINSSDSVQVYKNNNQISNKGDTAQQQHTSAYVLPAVYTPQQFYNNKRDSRADMDKSMQRADLASYNLVAGLRVNLCKQHCHCESKNKFIAVHCDFEQNQKLNRIFDADYSVPPEATSITIKLARRTQFELRRGFFNENRVNSITIEGTFSEKEQVELTAGALWSNNGGYPEIICHNVFAVVVRRAAFGGGDIKFTVRHSNDVILYRDAFNRTNINGLFYGINDLRIEEKAFNSDNAKLHIENTQIDNIYRFEASLREIRFVNCSIGTINGGTFDVNTVNSIIFEKCRINAIKARAITDKLMSNHVSFTNAVIGYIEKEAIYGSGITELILTRNDIDKIDEDAISVTAVNATIADNSIKRLGKHWLRIKEWSNISVQRNRFGLFAGMLLEDAKHPASCLFDSNSITRPGPGSLNLTNCRIHQISVDIPCTCNLTWLERLSHHDLRSEVSCTIDEKLAYCFAESNLNVLKYMNEVCDEQKTTLHCRRNQTLQRVNGNFFTKEELEQHDQRMPLFIFIAVGIAILTLLVVITTIVACRFCKSAHQQQLPNANIGHVHEFSATERTVIRHALEIMQKKYPDIYKPIHERSQLLLQTQLSDKKCVKTISQIVNYLSKVEHTTDDFMAFNRVLTQHLQPPSPTAPPTDPIYTEPGLSAIEGDFYTTSTIMGMPTHDYLSAQGLPPHNDGTPEHIYAEPSCAQQPLLHNEYASPADGNVVNMDLYSEPVAAADRDTHAYAVSGQQRQLPPYAIPIRPPAAMPAAASTSAHNARLLPDAKLPAPPKYSFQMSTFSPSSAALTAGVGTPLYTAPNLTHRVPPVSAQSNKDANTAMWGELQGAAGLTPDSGSNHSGGTDETVPMDDVIEYVDA